MKDFKTFVNENLLVPRNIEGRKKKLKQMNIKILSQEVIDGDLKLDESFMDIDPKFVKLKKVNGDINILGGWTILPKWLKDVEIKGNFVCSYNQLQTLENSPKNVYGSFYCHHNQLISLEGCTKKIGISFDCSYNKLTSLEGCPIEIGSSFRCDHNKIKLELPNYIDLKRRFNN